MFDIGWSEMAIIMLLALIIIGPKDLPRVARTIGQWVRKGRMLAREFQTSLEDMAKEADLDDVKKEIEKVGQTDFKKAVENSIDPKGELKQAFDTSNGASGEDTVVKALNGSTKTKADASAPSTQSPAEVEAPAKTSAAASSAKAAPKAARAPAKAKTTTSAKKPPTRAKKPASSTTRKTATSKARTAKKPAAPKKRPARPTSAAQSGTKPGAGDPPSADDSGGGSAAMAAKSS